MDRQWWEVHAAEVNETFCGSRYSINTLPARMRVERIPQIAFQHYGNSGAACISLAAQGNARRILLLGYDCQRTSGLSHWHGDHPPKLSNAAQINLWHANFTKQSKNLSALTIINCSRETALTCWPRMDLDEALREPAAA